MPNKNSDDKPDCNDSFSHAKVEQKQKLPYPKNSKTRRNFLHILTLSYRTLNSRSSSLQIAVQEISKQKDL